MKQIYILFTIMISLFNGNEINAQTEWTGPITTFIKANNADWTLEVNQDRITSNVWITRANNQSVFNIADRNSNILYSFWNTNFSNSKTPKAFNTWSGRYRTTIRYFPYRITD